MYTVAVKRKLVAQHYLVGGDWGAENHKHSHAYVVEVRLQGERLDEHGYLVDIVDIERRLDALVDRYRDRTLNDLPELAGLNPSVEHFCRVMCEPLAEALRGGALSAVEVRIWESDIAWASYRKDLR